jgi:hypothetical protein
MVRRWLNLSTMHLRFMFYVANETTYSLVTGRVFDIQEELDAGYFVTPASICLIEVRTKNETKTLTTFLSRWRITR